MKLMSERLGALSLALSLILIGVNLMPSSVSPGITGQHAGILQTIGELVQSTAVLVEAASDTLEPAGGEQGPFYLRPVARAGSQEIVLLEADTAETAPPLALTDGGAPEGGEDGEEQNGEHIEAENREVSERSGRTFPASLRLAPAQTGLATYYHPSLAGLRMANGRPYDPSAMTAASNRWPLGTVLLVTYSTNAATIEITDRGRFTHALDLSSGAFVRLAGRTDPGVIRVTIQEVEGLEELLEETKDETLP